MKFGNFIRGNYIRARIGWSEPNTRGGARFGKGLRACDQLPFEGFCKPSRSPNHAVDGGADPKKTTVPSLHIPRVSARNESPILVLFAFVFATDRSVEETHGKEFDG